MSLVSLKALVKRTEAAVKAEKDAKRKKVLTAALSAYQSALEAYKKEKHTVEKHTVEKHTAEEAEEATEEAAEEDMAATEEATEASEGDEPDDDDDEDGDEEAAAEARVATAILGAQAAPNQIKAIAGLVRKANAYDRTRKDVEMLKKQHEASVKNSMIDEALGAGGKPPRITPAEAIALRGASTKEVKFFLSMRKGAIVNTTDETVRIPGPSANGKMELDAATLQHINMAISAAPDKTDKVALRKSLIEAHEKRLAAGLNGAGRY